MRKNIVLISALASVLFAGNAFAQSTSTSSSSLSITSTPVTTSVTPGTSVPLGTITLTSPGGSFTVNSIPSTLNISGAGLAGNLSNCSLFNTSGASTTAALGPAANIVSGSNSFPLSPALTVSAGTPVTLQIRCDVSAATPSGSVFQFMTTSTSTVGSSVSGASLAAEADFVKQVPAGLNNAIIGIITLDTTHSNQLITVSSVPVSVSASSGANLNSLSNCLLTSSSGTVLTTGGNAVSAITGSNTFTLDAPMVVQPGGGALLVLRCNVSPSAPVGSTLTVGFSPAAFKAMANGAPITVTQGLQSNGQPGTNSGVITIGPAGSAASGVGTGSGTGSPSSPGIPNSGEGGNAPMTYAILLASLAVAIFAGRFAMRAR